jgi:glycosyltransferase involved in cell wall biosynthesis
MTPIITVVANAHREGLLATGSIKSIAQAKRVASECGLTVEIVAVLDRPDDTTREIFYELGRQGARLVEVDYGDPGLSRNHGVREASGEWIAFIDCDDLFCSNWLIDAHAAAAKDNRAIVWHPEVNVYFGSFSQVLIHIDMEDPRFDIMRSAISNLWTVLSFTRRKLLLNTPFTSNVSDLQVGFEDWTWNLDVIRMGGIHKIVKNTAHLIRSKITQSVMMEAHSHNCLPRPTNLFKAGLITKSALPMSAVE